MITEVRKPLKGAVRYFDKVGQSHYVVEPGHAGYMDALTVAEEYWSSDRDAWVQINPPTLRGVSTGRLNKTEPQWQELPRA